MSLLRYFATAYVLVSGAQTNHIERHWRVVMKFIEDSRFKCYPQNLFVLTLIGQSIGSAYEINIIGILRNYI